MWSLRMAWRDSRGQRRRLLLHTGSIAVGIAALTGLRGLSRSMEHHVEAQAVLLLGADLSVESHAPLTPQAQAVLDSLGGEQTRQVALHSMVYAPASGGTRLAEVRALEGRYPFYGTLRTEPPQAAQTWQAAGGALVDDGLLLQLGAQVGDTLGVGYVRLPIVGQLVQLPGQSELSADVQPPVLVPLRLLPQSGLLQPGSRAEHTVLVRLPEPGRTAEVARQLRERLHGEAVELETAADRQRHLGHVLESLYRFLGVGSFVALLLGAVGVASAVHAHVQSRLETVALLRSLGATARQAVTVYLLQAAGMGSAGALVGVLGGTALLLVMPYLLSGLLPAEVAAFEPVLSWLGMAEGLLVGAGVAVLFAALPLLAVRRVSPLLALRASYEAAPGAGDRLLRLLLGLLALGGTLGLARLLAGRTDHAVFLAGGTGAALLLLAAAACLLRGAVRRLFPARWPYEWRQGLANLYRPSNQTVLLVVSLGLGTFLVAALYTAQSSVLAHLQRIAGPGQPNMVFFDIQSDQRQEVAALVQGMGLPLLQQVPVVPMRVMRVNGRSVDEVAPPHGRHGGDWALRREYRSTYRAQLAPSESIVAGRWQGTAGDTTCVSLEEGIAAALGVGLGDSLVFDVQGVPVPAVVGSLRHVEWQRIMPNFLVVFPAGVLEEAPQFHVLVTRADSPAQRAALQRAVVQQFPNVSAIDLDLILRTVDSVIGRIAVVVRLVALIAVSAGLLLLIAVVSGSRLQRRRESALLRALGASRSQVGRILLAEYLFLGLVAGLVGVLLALAGGWGLARFVFNVTWAPPLVPLALALLAVPALTVAVGLAGSRGVQGAPPLEVLRRND